MKRLVFITSISALLVLLCLRFPVFAQPTHLPHENPARAQGGPFAVALLQLYGDTFNLVTNRQYQNARYLISELQSTALPPELSYVIDRYNILCQQLFTTLDNLDTLLAEITELLAGNQIEASRQKLADAKPLIYEARMLMAEVDTATEAMSEMMTLMPASAPGQLKTTYDRLLDSIRRVKLLIEEFNKLHQELSRQRLARQAQLTPTDLILSITPTTIFAGDNITVSARLNATGKPLADREITFITDSETASNAATDATGVCTVPLTIPCKWTEPYSPREYYVAPVILKAVYTPAGDDGTVYLGSESSMVINTRFYPTQIEFSAPNTAYPGSSITINGQVITNDDSNRIIRALLDETPLAKEVITRQFSLELKIPAQVSTGEHILKVSVSPAGRYAGTSVSRSINISREPPLQADIQIPSVHILLQHIPVIGRIHYEARPAPDASVTIDYRGASRTVRTGPDGSFNTSLNTAIDLSFLRPQEIALTIKPADSAPSLLVTRQIFMINPLTTGLLSAFAVYLGLATRRRFRLRPRKAKNAVEIEAAGLSPVFPMPEPHRLSGINGRVLAAYQNGLKEVEAKTGAFMSPQVTLREFLNVAGAMSAAVGPSFASLTSLAETALYSARSLDETIAARAEQLAGTIKKELHHDAP